MASEAEAFSLLPELLLGLRTTVVLVFASFALSLVVGSVWASMRVSRRRLLRGVGLVPTEYFRNTPLLVLMYLASSGLAKLGAVLTPMTAAILALGLYTSGYVAEIVRSGYNSVGSGQREAAAALGLSPLQTLRLVLLPQALRLVTGPLGTQFVLTIKNSSVASAIAVTDVLYRANNYSSVTFRAVDAYIGVALAYLLLTVPSSIASGALERRVGLRR